MKYSCGYSNLYLFIIITCSGFTSKVHSTRYIDNAYGKSNETTCRYDLILRTACY